MPEFPVLEDLKGLSEEDLLKSVQKPFSKLGKLLLGVLLLLILIPFFFPGDFWSILQGRLESSKIETYQVQAGSGRIIFEPEVYKELRSLYRSTQKTEIKVCLLGKRRGGEYRVTGLELPETFSKSVFHVSSAGCPKDTIIALHTHPFRHCLFSAQDIASYEAFKKVNPDALLGVMCEEDRFSFYGLP